MARGQQQRESRALADLGADVELERQQLDQALHDAQSQAVAVTRAVGRHADLVELVIDVGHLIGGNADARIQ